MSVIVMFLPFWIWDFMCVHCVLITLFAVWRNNSMYSNVTMVNIESSIKVIFQYQFMVVAFIYCQVVELEPRELY